MDFGLDRVGCSAATRYYYYYYYYYYLLTYVSTVRSCRVDYLIPPY